MALPDYYVLLNIPHNANDTQIRTAYKKESLRTHPDRVPQDASDRQRREATEKFQKVADAYYVLSDPVRRASYDSLRSSRPSFQAGGSGPSSTAGSSADYFSSFFKGATGFAAASDGPESEAERPDPDVVFGDVFEDLLRPEVNRHVPLWTWTGAAAGAALGFIAGNLPGLALGAYGGSKLGAIRDAKGKAVVEVFKELGVGQRAAILKALALKVLGSVAGA